MNDFKFITISSDPKTASKDVGARRLIRTTATRATRSQKVKETSKRHQLQSEVARETSQQGGMTKFRTRQFRKATTGKELVSTQESTPSPAIVQVSLWDPVVGPLGDQAWTLLHYYRYTFRARSWAINAKREWFAFIIEDPVAAHATLSFVSLNRDLELGSLVSKSSLHHRAKAMQLVRQRLSTARPFHDDTLIGAVALLAITEGLEGNFSLSVAHMEALTRLVGSRGGFEKLRKNEALSRLVAWADLCHTASSQSHRHLPGLFTSSDITLPVEDASQDKARASFQKSVKNAFSPHTYRLVKLLAAVPRYPPTDQTSAGERQNISRLIYCINQNLQLVQELDHNSGSDPVRQLTNVLHRAAYLYIALVLRQMPRRTQVVIERAKAVYTSLEGLRFDDYWQTSWEDSYLLIQLWSSTIYFCSLLPEDRQPGLYVKMRRLIKNLQIDNTDALEHWLGQISWMSGFAHQELSNLWHNDSD